MNRSLLSLCSAILLLALASGTAHATFVPENQIAPVESLPRGKSNMTEAEFKGIVSNIQNKYSAVVSALGGRLSISGDWKSEKLNAGAQQMFGNWNVVITGGLARRPELTPDGFALILCHELGHHLAGFPIAPADSPFTGAWAAVEGQSDYFATQVCARKLWADEKAKNAEFRQTASDFIKQNCNRTWSSIDDQNLCYRTVVGVESTIVTMATLMKTAIPQFHTPDPNVVTKTNVRHPAVQCRMDTSLQGAICPVPWNEAIVPGKTASGGVDSVAAEEEAANVSCMQSKGFNFGRRPACWFKARL